MPEDTCVHFLLPKWYAMQLCLGRTPKKPPNIHKIHVVQPVHSSLLPRIFCFSLPCLRTL